MMTRFRVGVMLALCVLACAPPGMDGEDPDLYRGFSRFSDPVEMAGMLDRLPDDVIGICDVAGRQTVHHNLRPYFGIPRSEWDDMPRVWPPALPALLRALAETGPNDLYGDRRPGDRIVSGCILESHLLAGMLRYRGIPTRIRAGYFKGIRGHREHVVEFWLNVARAKGIEEELLRENPDEWEKVLSAGTLRQNEVDHHIEHWACEYWDDKEHRWRLLDANTTFLKASSDIEVGFHLPGEHFEYAFDAWKRMRSDPEFEPDQYRESQYDGRSHIRSQLIFDFLNLLNHDVPCFDPDTGDMKEFIKERTYEDLTAPELEELDTLATLMALDPSVDELVEFYFQSSTLRIASAERDRYSFVHKE